jgi:hypothetical protein
MTSRDGDFGASFSSTLLVLLWLWNIAVAQPVYGVLGSSASFFVAHRVDPIDLMFFGVVYSLAAPLLLSLSIEFLRRASPAGAALYENLLWSLLIALVAAQGLRLISVAPLLAVAMAGGLGLMGTLLLRRSPALHGLFRWLGLAALIFLAAFVFSDPARKLFSGSETSRSSGAALKPLTVVFVIFDELPLVSLLNAEARINAARFPNFAALAETATWYRNATTVAASTVYAVPSMLAGRYPPDKDVALNAVWQDYPDNLFSRLGARANFNVVELRTRLCPDSICAGRANVVGRGDRLGEMLQDSTAVYLHQVAPLGWRDQLPPIDETWRDFWQSEGDTSRFEEAENSEHAYTGGPFEEFLDRIAEVRDPSLHFLHLMMPHLPWELLPSGQSYRKRRMHGLVRRRWEGSEWEVVQAQQRHLLQVGYADRLLGRLRAELEVLGRWDGSLVVISSDHGTAFEKKGYHARRFPDAHNLVEIANIPLLVKYSGQTAGSIDDSNVETIDIAPTILEAFGLESKPGSDPSIDGLSLAGEARHPEPKKISLSGNQGSKAGGRLQFDTSQIAQQRGTVLARNNLRFDAGGWEDVYRIGPHREMIGRPTNEFFSSSAEVDRATTVRLEWADDFQAVDLEAARLPVHINGALEGPTGESAWTLAVALNGIVQSVTETFVENSVVRFTAMVAPEGLIEGANRVEIFRVSGAKQAARLHALVIKR